MKDLGKHSHAVIEVGGLYIFVVSAIRHHWQFTWPTRLNSNMPLLLNWDRSVNK